ncbi:MAG TPA: hypothetical protein VMW02_01220, partial [Thermoplasmata archaeon]|nr:hypothetical protein [Thermoplasmata archaeon]
EDGLMALEDGLMAEGGGQMRLADAGRVSYIILILRPSNFNTVSMPWRAEPCRCQGASKSVPVLGK